MSNLEKRLSSSKVYGVVIPTVLPTTIGGAGDGTVTLPIVLPMSFGGGVAGKVTLPITLPMSFSQGGSNRKEVKLPTKVTCEFANEKKSVKLPMKEISNAGMVKLPVREVCWVLHGLVLEENIITSIKTPLILIEDIRSRILTETEMVNGTDVRIKWFGDSVPKVEIYKKMLTDEEYDLVSTHEWSEENAVITIGNGDHNIWLKGNNSTGESAVIALGETTYKEVDVTVEIPLNEKIYDFSVENISTYRIEVNY